MYRFAALIAAFVGLIGLADASAQDVEFITYKDISYGDHGRQKLDIYAPATIEPGTPIVVFFHGGAWRYGEKEDLSDQGKSFAGSGVIFVTANYRLFPDAVFPEFVEDAAAAVTLTLDTFNANDGEPHPLFLSGWSAGAYNAALLAYDERFLAQHGIRADIVKGLIGLSGPYEGGLCAGVRCGHIFPEEARSDWNVAGHVESDEPPALLIVAERDPYVPARHHEDLIDAIRRAGGRAALHVLPSDSHFATQAAMLQAEGEVRALIREFMAGVISD